MRWLSLLFSAAFPLTALAAAKKPVFDDFHAKAVASAPVKLSDSSYKKLTAVPRDHSVAVVLTALDQRYQCGLCHEFQPEWELLARSWTKGDKKAESRVIFSTLDFADGRDTFMSVCYSIIVLQYNIAELNEHANTTAASPSNSSRAASIPAYNRSSCRPRP